VLKEGRYAIGAADGQPKLLEERCDDLDEKVGAARQVRLERRRTTGQKKGRKRRLFHLG